MPNNPKKSFKQKFKNSDLNMVMEDLGECLQSQNKCFEDKESQRVFFQAYRDEDRQEIEMLEKTNKLLEKTKNEEIKLLEKKFQKELKNCESVEDQQTLVELMALLDESVFEGNRLRAELGRCESQKSQKSKKSKKSKKSNRKQEQSEQDYLKGLYKKLEQWSE